ncbi:MAG: hypothetical protein PHH83_03840 [Patescibacteria group bacterium]|nr:hypothetical protein [Patescibacteria group bacterium]
MAQRASSNPFKKVKNYTKAALGSTSEFLEETMLTDKERTDSAVWRNLYDEEEHGGKTLQESSDDERSRDDVTKQWDQNRFQRSLRYVEGGKNISLPFIPNQSGKEQAENNSSYVGDWNKKKFNNKSGRNNNENLSLSNTGELNRKLQNTQEESNDESKQANLDKDGQLKNLSPIGEENKRRRLAEKIRQKMKESKIGQSVEKAKTSIANKAMVAKKAVRLGTFATYKVCWQYLIPSFGLTWFYLIFHFIAKYIFGSIFFCHFVSITNPAVSIKEITEGKDKMDFGAMISFVVLSAIILFLLALIFTILSLLAHILINPVDSIKAYYKLLWDLFKGFLGDLVGLFYEES